MSIELNHTIVHVKDRWAAARDVGEVLGLPEATAYGPFAELKLDNAASLDFMDTEGEIHGQHYAFLVSEDEFDLILGRLRDDRPRVVGRPLQASTARDQPRGRWPGPLLGGSRRALVGDHHSSLRQRRLTPEPWTPSRCPPSRSRRALPQTSSGTISMAPQGHSDAHRPQPLQ